MATKMNMVAKFNAVIDSLEGKDSVMTTEEMVTFLKSRIEVIENKANNKKSTKTQEANEDIKTDILNVLTAEGMTAGAVLKALKSVNAEKYEDVSNQKISALLRQLGLEGKVAKTKDKKTSIFSLA